MDSVEVILTKELQVAVHHLLVGDSDDEAEDAIRSKERPVHKICARINELCVRQAEESNSDLGEKSRVNFGNANLVEGAIKPLLIAGTLRIRRNCCGEDVDADVEVKSIFDDMSKNQNLSWKNYKIGVKRLSDIEVLSICVDLVRVLRTLCAGILENQHRILRSRCLHHIFAVLKNYPTFATGSKNWVDSAQRFAYASLTLFCNVVNQNELAKETLWTNNFPGTILNVCLESNDYKLMKYSVLFVHYCTTGMDGGVLESTKDKRLFSLVIEKRKLYTLLMKCSEMCRPNLFGTLHNERENNLEEEVDDEAEAEAVFQIISWIVEQIINSGLMRAAIGPDLSFNTNENIVFLYHWLDHVSADPDLRNGITIWQENQLASDALRLLESLLCEMTKMDYSDSGRSHLNLGSMLILKLLGVYTSIAEAYPKDGDITSLLSLVIEELRRSSSIFGYRSELVRIIANACHRRRVNQDFIREAQGMIPVLNCANIDESNPFIREWTIFAIRNLTEDNEENQKIIAELRVQGIVDTPILEKAGVKIELTDEGKPKLVSR